MRDKEYTNQRTLEMEEKYKNLVEWMQVIITSTRSASTAQEDYDLSDEAIGRLKMRVNNLALLVFFFNLKYLLEYQ